MGPRHTIMPPRGGYPDLTDDQVNAAAAFVITHGGGRDMVDAWLQTRGTP